mmetsp:Transcript_6821/g.13863  ORF Transcript_6821/g.13863 Transcript_6821/m.13863 type:complete len:111 (+) Transcript_6821:1023-1355(+)
MGCFNRATENPNLHPNFNSLPATGWRGIRQWTQLSALDKRCLRKQGISSRGKKIRASAVGWADDVLMFISDTKCCQTNPSQREADSHNFSSHGSPLHRHPMGQTSDDVIN